jgi:hypothetical protein
VEYIYIIYFSIPELLRMVLEHGFIREHRNWEYLGVLERTDYGSFRLMTNMVRIFSDNLALADVEIT